MMQGLEARDWLVPVRVPRVHSCVQAWTGRSL